MRARLLVVLVVLVVLAGCRSQTVSPTDPPTSPRRLSVSGVEYGAHPDFPDALGPGDALDGSVAWSTADGPSVRLADLRLGGPVVVVYLGGAEHEFVTQWATRLSESLRDIEARGASLVFVRPIDAQGALRWAIDLRVQAVVVGDPDGAWLRAMGLPDATLVAAVWIVDRDGRLRYRKLADRRPEVDELLGVLDGVALRCCPAVCVDEACEVDESAVRTDR